MQLYKTHPNSWKQLNYLKRHYNYADMNSALCRDSPRTLAKHLGTSPPWVDDGWMDHSSFHGVSVHIGQRLSPGKTFFFLVLFKQKIRMGLKLIVML